MIYTLCSVWCHSFLTYINNIVVYVSLNCFKKGDCSISIAAKHHQHRSEKQRVIVTRTNGYSYKHSFTAHAMKHLGVLCNDQ
jgi:hypothetical protein